MDTSVNGPYETEKRNQVAKPVRHASRINGFDENVWYV